MCRRARFGNCDDVTATDNPGQRDSGCRAPVCCADMCKRGVAHTVASEWSIGHHRHTMPLTPRQQIMLNVPAANVVENLICRAAIAVWNTEKIFHVADFEIGYAPGPYP